MWGASIPLRALPEVAMIQAYPLEQQMELAMFWLPHAKIGNGWIPGTSFFFPMEDRMSLPLLLEYISSF